MKRMTEASVCGQREISENIYDLVLAAPEIAAEAKAGQFVNLYLHDRSRLLPRPISLCEIDPAAGTIRLVYRVNGAGTAEMASLTAGDTIRVMGPLGNGFPVETVKPGSRVFLVGGGVGVPPLVETAKRLKGTAEVVSVMGYRSEPFLREDFERQGELLIATEDGCEGVKGNVLDAIRADGRIPDLVFACGPLPMLRALKSWAEENRIPLYISMEERMACGIGACLACVCETTETDAHSHVHNARVCKDGPVFDAKLIKL